ncbi:hypothetical protein BHM03_00049769, partial [Ensete ventricosum]
VGRCTEIGVPMLILFIASSQYLKHLHVRRLPVLERFSLLITITIAWVYAHLLTVGGAYKYRPEHTQFNCRTDRANLISSAPWSVVLLQSTGAYKAAARLASATPPPAHVLSRGIGWQFTNMNSMRNLFIIGVSIFLGLSVPQYFFRYSMSAQHGPAHTKASWFNDYMNTIFSSPPTVALIVAVFLDNTLDFKDTGKDRGMPWWARFRTFNGDSRNEEFYTLPFNLDRFFPPS